MFRVAVSGGFDPLHSGHIEYFKLARALGDRLIVIVNTDEWLIQKKGYAFMPLNDRFIILESIRWVDAVVVAIDQDDTVAETLRCLKPDIFAKGGDRRSDADMPPSEIKVCREIGCRIVYGVGGYEKADSSRALVERAVTKFKELGR